MVDSPYKIVIAGFEFDNRMILAAEHLIEAFLLFNNLDNDFADQDGAFYGPAYKAAMNLLYVMGFEEKETDTILMEMSDQSLFRCSMERVLMARRDDDTGGGEFAASGHYDSIDCRGSYMATMDG